MPALLLLTEAPLTMPFLLVIVATFNALVAILGNVWTSWMAELVPQDRWGRYFGLRNTILGVVGMTVAYLGARSLDGFKSAGQPSLGFGWLLVAASCAAMVAAALLALQPEAPIVRRPTTLFKTVTEPLASKRYRKLLAFIAFWYITSGVASPFYGVHMLDRLHMPYSGAATYGIVAGTTALVFQLLWGRAIDRFRAKPVLQLSFVGVAALPLFWLFATPSFLAPIWIDSLLTGIFWTGVNAALFALVLGSVSETQAKESTIALFTTVTGLSGFVSATAGGVIAETLSSWQIELVGQSFTNYHVLFAITSLARFLSLFLLARVEDPGAATARVTLAAMGDYGLRRLSMAKELHPRALALGIRRLPRNRSRRQQR